MSTYPAAPYPTSSPITPATNAAPKAGASLFGLVAMMGAAALLL
jgi:hypothetical protein